jgi:acetylornithine deacetylase/succinyl-diaminopimelate desuccinylase-like protein
MDVPVAREVLQAVQRVRGPVVAMPTLGGSVPLYIFEEELGAPLIGIPIANHDNNQHSANENIRFQNLWDGIAVMAALMSL